MGWSRLVGDRVQVHLVPGNHITMLSSGPVAALAESLALRLRDAGTATRTGDALSEVRS
jgi:thioesterase domain-containing protein